MGTQISFATGWHLVFNAEVNDMSKKRVAIAAIITMLGFSSTAWSDSAKLVNPSGGHFYQRIDAEENWNNAKTSCANLGAYLATITSQSENDWIQETLSTGNQILIGGTDAAIEGTWTWITGETWSYTNWNYGNQTTRTMRNHWKYYLPGNGMISLMILPVPISVNGMVLGCH